MLDQISCACDQGTAEPRMRPAPSPRRGEGWGEGVTNDREFGPPSPPPSPRWGEGVPPCRIVTPCLPTSSARYVFVLPVCAMLGVIAASSAQAQDVASFYAGKSIRLVVGIDVGSGYDVNARLLALYLGNHIPGKPTIVVQNQPGAGSAIMTSQLYSAGPFDGTAIGAAFAGMPTQPLLQPGSGIRFDPVKLLWLGNTNRETHVTYVWHNSPVQSLDELKTRQLIMGAQAPGSSQVDFPLAANALFGLKFKIISGYGSTSKINLALESGEVQGTIEAWTSVQTLSSHWLAHKN